MPSKRAGGVRLPLGGVAGIALALVPVLAWASAPAGAANSQAPGVAKVSHLLVTPTVATVDPGVAQTYTADRINKLGKVLGSITATSTFSISPNGVCVGATCSATTPGPHTITAVHGSARSTASLTVKPPTAEDDFLRPDTTAGWGSTTNPDGIANLPWGEGFDGSSPDGFISGGHGTIVYTGTDGHKLAGYVDTALVLGGDTLAEFRFSATDAALAGVIVQHSDVSNWYQADVSTVTAYGFTKNTLELTVRRAGVMIHAADVPFAVVPDTNYWMREVVQVSNGVAHIAARAWKDGTPEPNSWSVTYDDPTPLPAGNGGAMGDWLKHPQPGEEVQFGAWSYTSP